MELGVAALTFAVLISPLIGWLMWLEDFDGWRSDRVYRRELRQRDRLTPHQFYERFYGTSGIDERLVVDFIDFNARFWGVDSERMRPEDNYPAIDGHCQDDEFIKAVERAFGVSIPVEDYPEIDGSFDSIIRYIHRGRQRASSNDPSTTAAAAEPLRDPR